MDYPSNGSSKTNSMPEVQEHRLGPTAKERCQVSDSKMEHFREFERDVAAAIERVALISVEHAMEKVAFDQIVDRLATRIGGYQVRLIIEKVKE